MSAVVPQGASWSSALQPQIAQMAAQYTGTPEECEAQALRDMINHAAEKHEVASLTLGAMLVVTKNRKLFERLGYSSMREFIQQERVGNLGRSQCYKLMAVAAATPPQALSAPTLGTPVLDTRIPRPTLTPAFVAEHGIERSYALVQKWSDASEEQREEIVQSLDAPGRDFYRSTYGKSDEASFSVEGDDVMLWQDGVGSKVAVLTTLDSEERRLLLDRLGTVPKPRF